MTSNSLARTALTLFGVYLMVECFVTLGGAFSNAPLVVAPGDATGDMLLTQGAIVLASRFGAALIFELLPGLIIVSKSTAWADRLVPPADEAVSHIEPRALLAIGLILLGLSFLVTGLAGTAGSVVAAILADDLGRELAWRQSASALVMAVAGGVLVLVGYRTA